MKTYNETMQGYLTLINEALDDLLTPSGEAYDRVLEAMRYSVMNAGKRVRPILTLEFCRMLGGDVQEALPFACAVELIHCYSLIHDDLPCMDDDDLRRGKPSCHKQFDEATALLAGDALLTKAFETAAGAPLGKKNPNAVLRCMQELSYYAGVDGMIGGQAIDLAQEGHQVDTTEALLSQMHNLKTAALLKSACEMGAIAASAAPEQILNAELYGESLGLAFQLVDDILDVTGDEASLGKPIGSDAQNDKVTYITLCGLSVAKSMAEDYTKQALDIVKGYPDSGFLQELTEHLLTRNN